MKICAVCGTASEDGVVHCGICGELLDPSFAPKKRYRVLLASLLALSAVSGYLAWRAGYFSGVEHRAAAKAPARAVNPLTQMASAVGP